MGNCSCADIDGYSEFSDTSLQLSFFAFLFRQLSTLVLHRCTDDSIFNYFQPSASDFLLIADRWSSAICSSFCRSGFLLSFLTPLNRLHKKRIQSFRFHAKALQHEKQIAQQRDRKGLGHATTRVSNGIIFFSSQKSMMAFVPPFALPFSFSTRDLESSSLYAFGKMSGKIKNADFEK